jgi:hypothetical protein
VISKFIFQERLTKRQTFSFLNLGGYDFENVGERIGLSVPLSVSLLVSQNLNIE